MMTNVLIIEDDPMVAELNRTFVESIPNMNVIESFRNVEEGKKYFRQKNADLLPKAAKRRQIGHGRQNITCR